MSKEKQLIGSAEIIGLPRISTKGVHARIDSGARTSSVWGSARVGKNGHLFVAFFGESQKYEFEGYGQQVVASSTGHTEQRFTVKMPVLIKGRRILATFTIANRSSQVYPVLIGRNVLRGKFIVDVELGNRLKTKEKARIAELQSELQEEGQ